MTGRLVGLCGLAGSGKSTAAQVLIDEGWVPISFADPIREMLLALDPEITYRGCTMLLSGIVRMHGWDTAKRECPPIRRLLQRFGTEVGRNILGEHFWVDWAEDDIVRAIKDGKNVVLVDVRFPNEAALIKRWEGKVVKIRRPGVQALGHVSEAMDFEADVVIHNDGDLQYLHDQIRECARD